MNEMIDDDNLISALGKLPKLKPKNSEYFVNLKKRLVNQRIMDLESEEIYEEPTKKSLFTAPFILSIMMLISIVVLSLFVLFLPSIKNLNTNNDGKLSNNVINKKNEIIIGDKKIVAQEYEIENSFVSVKLPDDWEFTNSDNFDFEKGEVAAFVDSDKQLVVSQNITEEQFKDFKAEENSKTLIINDLEVIKVGDVAFASSNSLEFTNNYIIKKEDGLASVILSFEKDDEDYLKAIVENLKFEDPYKDWSKLNLESSDIDLFYKNTWDKLEVDNENQDISYNFEDKASQIELNLSKLDSEVIIDSEVFYYGREVLVNNISELQKEITFEIDNNFFKLELTKKCTQKETQEIVSNDYMTNGPENITVDEVENPDLPFCNESEIKSFKEQVSEDIKLFIGGIKLKFAKYSDEAITFEYPVKFDLVESKTDKKILLKVNEDEVYSFQIVTDIEKFELDNISKYSNLGKYKDTDWTYFSSVDDDLELFVYESGETSIILTKKPNSAHIESEFDRIIDSFEAL